MIEPASELTWEDLARAWELAPGVVYLNHGSFGPPPGPVQAAREAWQRRIARNPMRYLSRGIEQDVYLREAREPLARMMGCAADDLIFVENSTVAMNLVAANLPLVAGDEVLLTDHEYGAVVRLWQRRCADCRARLVLRELPYPLFEAEELITQLFAAANERTRLLVVSHVTSPTAVVLPIERICREARRRGIAVCVDGPHAVAMRDVNLSELDCDYYTASCHKWLCAPLGTGFLYVHPRHQEHVRPLIVSWGRTPQGATPSWRDEFLWVGTRDPSAYLSVPAAIEFLAGVGWRRFRLRTHELARYARQRIEELTGLPSFVPDSIDWYGSMIALPLPAGDAPALQRALVERFGIEVPIIPWHGRRFVRPSCHLYTTSAHVDRLADALRERLAAGD